MLRSSKAQLIWYRNSVCYAAHLYVYIICCMLRDYSLCGYKGDLASLHTYTHTRPLSPYRTAFWMRPDATPITHTHIHTRAHTHTHTYTHTRPLSPYRTAFWMRPDATPITHRQASTQPGMHAHTHTLTHTRPLSPYPCRTAFWTRPDAMPITHRHTHTLSHTHTHPLSPYPYRTAFWTRPGATPITHRQASTQPGTHAHRYMPFIHCSLCHHDVHVISYKHCCFTDFSIHNPHAHIGALYSL